MKENKYLFALIGLCLFLGLTSCAEDRRIFGDDIDIPELTDDNTVQFTVEVASDWKQIEVIAGGGRMAIEWGDGRLQKVEDPGTTGPINYKYGNRKSYRVRIWAEELDFLSVSGLLLPATDLRMGYLPRMRSLNLNSFSGTTELDLSNSCPNVEDINIGNWTDLERLELNQCKQLERADIYTNPRLTSLNIVNLPKLKDLNCAGNGLTALSLDGVPALRTLYCNNNPLTTIDLGDDMTIAGLYIQNCAFSSLAFLDKLPLLSEFSCRSNQLTTLDLSKHRSLRFLDCSFNKKLNYLSIPANNQVQILRCHSCNLKANTLDIIFDALIALPKPSTPEHEKDYRISFYDNPGENTCDVSILKNKNWYIDTNKN